jgi:hypothetical protein
MKRPGRMAARSRPLRESGSRRWDDRKALSAAMRAALYFIRKRRKRLLSGT